MIIFTSLQRKNHLGFQEERNDEDEDDDDGRIPLQSHSDPGQFSRSSSSTFPFLHQHLYPFSSLSSSSSEAHSFTVSHLINSYGFSHKQALLASKYTNFKTLEKPNLVFAFFDSHGFSKSQIS